MASTDLPLTEQHLAALHARAEELGVPGFRMLSREELIAAIEDAEREDGAPEAVETDAADRDEAPERDAPKRRSRRRGRRGGRGRWRGCEREDREEG